MQYLEQEVHFQGQSLFGIVAILIIRVAQSCHLGNQAKLVLGPHMSTNQQKKFVGKNISRFRK